MSCMIQTLFIPSTCFGREVTAYRGEPIADGFLGVAWGGTVRTSGGVMSKSIISDRAAQVAPGGR